MAQWGGEFPPTHHFFKFRNKILMRVPQEAFIPVVSYDLPSRKLEKSAYDCFLAFTMTTDPAIMDEDEGTGLLGRLPTASTKLVSLLLQVLFSHWV